MEALGTSRAATTCGCVAVVTALGIRLTNLGTVAAVSGAFVSTSLAYVLPSVRRNLKIAVSWPNGCWLLLSAHTCASPVVLLCLNYPSVPLPPKHLSLARATYSIALTFKAFLCQYLPPTPALHSHDQSPSKAAFSQRSQSHISHCRSCLGRCFKRPWLREGCRLRRGQSFCAAGLLLCWVFS